MSFSLRAFPVKALLFRQYPRDSTGSMNNRQVLLLSASNDTDEDERHTSALRMVLEALFQVGNRL